MWSLEDEFSSSSTAKLIDLTERDFETPQQDILLGETTLWILSFLWLAIYQLVPIWKENSLAF